jgi:hypothetical protein
MRFSFFCYGKIQRGRSVPALRILESQAGHHVVGYFGGLRVADALQKILPAFQAVGQFPEFLDGQFVVHPKPKLGL